MERIREAVIGFYENRRREFFMLVVLVLLVIVNTFSYFSGSPYNMFAMMFGKRGAKKTAVTQQQNQPQVATETVKENQKLQEAATNAGTGTPQQSQNAPVKKEETQTPEPHATTEPATPAAQEKTTAEVSPQKNEETKTQMQAGKPAPEAQKTSQAYVFAKTGYQILDKTFFYRDDPFNPIVKSEPVGGGHGGGWIPPPSPPRRVCGSLVLGGSVHSTSGFAWPTEKTLPTSFDGGIPPLPGLEGVEIQTVKSGQGVLKLTGIIFDSQPVANIKFNGKDFSVRMNEWVGSCRVVAISRSQVVLAEPGGKQRRLYL